MSFKDGAFLAVARPRHKQGTHPQLTLAFAQQVG